MNFLHIIDNDQLPHQNHVFTDVLKWKRSRSCSPTSVFLNNICPFYHKKRARKRKAFSPSIKHFGAIPGKKGKALHIFVGPWKCSKFMRAKAFYSNVYKVQEIWTQVICLAFKNHENFEMNLFKWFYCRGFAKNPKLDGHLCCCRQNSRNPHWVFCWGRHNLVSFDIPVNCLVIHCTLTNTHAEHTRWHACLPVCVCTMHACEHVCVWVASCFC